MGKGTGKGELCKCITDDVKMLDDSDTRRCTDIPFLLLFLVAVAGMGYVTDWCFENGDPYMLVYGADSWGNVCGRDNTNRVIAFTNTSYVCDNCALDMRLRPHQFLTDVGFTKEEQKILGVSVPDFASDLKETMVICAKACPDKSVTCDGDLANFTYCKETLGLCLSTKSYTVPTEEGNPDRSFEYPVGSDKYSGCPKSVVKTDEAMYIQRCIPESWSDGLNTAGDVLSYAEQLNEDFANDFFTTYIGQIYDSFYASWREVAYCLLIALVVAYLIIVLMRFFVGPIVVLLIILSILLSSALTWFLYTRWEYTDEAIKDQEKAKIPITVPEKRERDFYQVTGIVMLVFTILITLIVIALRNDIRIAIKVYEEASIALRKMPTIFITPLTTWIMIFAFFTCWLFAMCFMVTSDDVYPVYIDNSTFFYGHVKYVAKENYDPFFWFAFFALFWVVQFFLACQQMIIAGSVAKYYVTGGKPKNGAFCRAVWNMTRYHLGTACLGSLIIAIVQFVRLIFEYIKRKTDGPQKSTIQKFLERCLTCCLWCLEKCLKFINKNAYIETMLCGLDFCNAACHAFKVILKNILKIGALSFVGTIVVFMIKLMTACLVAFIAFEWLKDRPEIPILGIVVAFIFLVGWWIGDAFASVYEMVADTLLICFCEDKAQNKGGDPVGPRSLTKMISKHAAIRDKDKVTEIEKPKQVAEESL